MSERPTPRTASAMMEIPSKFNSIWVVPAETACDLERELGDALCERNELREENKWLVFFLEHIRDNADIRYGKHRGLLAFSYLREEASRNRKEGAK